MCKTICSSNVFIAKNFDSVNHCFVTCTKHTVNVISSAVSYRIACPVYLDIVVSVVNVTDSCIYCCFSLEIFITLLPLFLFWNFHYILQTHQQHTSKGEAWNPLMNYIPPSATLPLTTLSTSPLRKSSTSCNYLSEYNSICL